MGVKRNWNKFWLENLKERENEEELGVTWRMILGGSYRKKMGGSGLDSYV
jgi:hypothetical protein